MNAEQKKSILETYDWIKVPRYRRPGQVVFNADYDMLEKHHKEETEFLINFIRDLVRNMPTDTTRIVIPSGPAEVDYEPFERNQKENE